VSSMDLSGPATVSCMTTGSPNQVNAASTSEDWKGRRISRAVRISVRICPNTSCPLHRDSDYTFTPNLDHVLLVFAGNIDDIRDFAGADRLAESGSQGWIPRKSIGKHLATRSELFPRSPFGASRAWRAQHRARTAALNPRMTDKPSVEKVWARQRVQFQSRRQSGRYGVAAPIETPSANSSTSAAFLVKVDCFRAGGSTGVQSS
jgi:hypothetical protein